MSQSRPKLESSIKMHLAPLLKSQGYKGNGRTFRREETNSIHLVNVQGFTYGGRFAVNLAVHPKGLPTTNGSSVDFDRITEEVCEFRTRLTDAGPGRSWDHDGTAEGMNVAMIDATKIYKDHSRMFFEHFTGPASVLLAFDPASLASSTPDLKPYCFGSEVRVAYVMARLRSLQGRAADAKAFAIFGLAITSPDFEGHHELQRIARGA